MIVKISNLKLVIAERTDMPERSYNEVSKKWEKTGKSVERTTYTLKDILTSEKLVFIGSNDWRDLEGEQVEAEIDISHNDYARKNQLSLKLLSPEK